MKRSPQILPDNTRQAANFLRQAEGRATALARLRELRSKASAEIERLIAFLDASDLDPDLEPSLGFPEANISLGGGGFYGPSYTSEGDQTRYAGETDDRESDDSDREPSLCGITAHGLNTALPSLVEDGEQEADDEPGLGSVDGQNQERWAAGMANDAEWECEDEGAHDDREPSLGWTIDGCRGGYSEEEVR